MLTCWHIELSILGLCHLRNAWLNCLLWSPIRISKFNLQAIILRKVPQIGNQSMARTPAFFAGRLRASPLHSMIKTQNAKSKIVGWHKKFVQFFLIQNVLKNSEIFYHHNHNFFGTKTYAKRPETWDVPDWFRCMCEFQVRQVMSPQI